MTRQEYLLDVSRLIWRRWSRRLPTGIDRVCLEYVRHFGPRAQAVTQYNGRVFVLSPKDSARLFNLLSAEKTGFRRRLLADLPLALARASRRPPRGGMIYLNVGHTGLEGSGLPSWVARGKVKAVYLIHDLIPITHPEFCRSGEAATHRLRIKNALASAAVIACNSEVTRAALREFAQAAGLAMPPTIVSWISAPPLRSPVAPKAAAQPYFVALGTIEARKNHLLLLNVWRNLAIKMGSRAPGLVIIGQRGWEAEKAIAILDDLQGLREHVYEVSRSGDEELASWLAGARALLMPSFVEGFGLPVIEALQMGVPVIASNLQVYHEIVGDVPTYLDALDPPAWERTIMDFMADGPERSRQLRELRQFEAPGWAGHFAAVEDWLGSSTARLATVGQSAKRSGTPPLANG